LNRDDLVSVLHAENVLARKYFWPGCHRMEPYRSYYPNAHLLLPETERIAARILVLPTGTALSAQEARTICQIIATALRHAGAVKAALNRQAGTKPA
jgi:dTDP-4-amino-4,6-dideoxygalactose transaminase